MCDRKLQEWEGVSRLVGGPHEVDEVFQNKLFVIGHRKSGKVWMDLYSICLNFFVEKKLCKKAACKMLVKLTTSTALKHLISTRKTMEWK
jgi:hypothetical protein